MRPLRDGIPQPKGIGVGLGEQLKGVRLVFAYSNAVVRGQVNVLGGKLPENARVAILAHRFDGSEWEFAKSYTYADARGVFILEGLIPGQYELEISIMFYPPIPPDWQYQGKRVRQPVGVTSGQATQVTLTLDLSQ